MVVLVEQLVMLVLMYKLVDQQFLVFHSQELQFQQVVVYLLYYHLQM